MRKPRWAAVCLIAGIGIVVAAAATADAAAKPAYFRYPDIHGDRIVFAAEADLWLVPDLRRRGPPADHAPAARSTSPVLAGRHDGSPSPASTTATRTSS